MSVVGRKNQETREKWLEKTLKKIPSGSRILDAGAGELKYKSFCSHLSYVSQDFAQYNGKGDGAGLQTVKWDQSRIDITSDISSIPEPDASFDAIMCIEVFEHLPEPIVAIQEFTRLLKPNGHLIITAPFCSLTHFAPYHYYSGFNIYFYKTFLYKYGFEIIDLQSNGNFFEYLAQEIRRIPWAAKQYISKHSTVDLSSRLAIKRVLSLLEHLSLKDIKSQELLNFGYHVYAIKSR